MEELAKIIKSFDDEKKKKLFSDLSNAETIEAVMDVGNNYNLNITKDIAQKMYDGFKNAEKLTKEELAKMAGGASEAIDAGFWGIYCFFE